MLILLHNYSPYFFVNPKLGVFFFLNKLYPPVRLPNFMIKKEYETYLIFFPLLVYLHLCYIHNLNQKFTILHLFITYYKLIK